MSDAYRCACGDHLEKVTQSANSMLNSEQFDAARMGDWFCRRCPTNEGKNRYFWDSDIAALAAAPAQSALHPITGEPIGTDAQEATAWQVKAENLERENAALRELIAEAPSYFAPQYDFEGRKLAWIKSADAAISAQGDSHE